MLIKISDKCLVNPAYLIFAGIHEEEGFCTLWLSFKKDSQISTDFRVEYVDFNTLAEAKEAIDKILSLNIGDS